MVDFEDGQGAPKGEVEAPELPEIKLFGKWSLDEVQLSDMSLQVSCSQVFFIALAHCDLLALNVIFILVDEIPYNFALQDYIAVKKYYAKYLPHSAGRYAAKRFRKAQCPIVERLTNSLMMHGRNNGKKLMAVRIVKHSFEIIHLLTGEVSSVSQLGFSFVDCAILCMVYIVLDNTSWY